jgi:hypothetical protein
MMGWFGSAVVTCHVLLRATVLPMKDILQGQVHRAIAAR